MAPQGHHDFNKAIGPPTNADNERSPAAQGPDESSLGSQHDKPIVIDDDDEEEKDNAPTHNDSDEDDDDLVDPFSSPEPEEFYDTVVRKWTVEMFPPVNPTQEQLDAYELYLDREVTRQIELTLNGRHRNGLLHIVRTTISFIGAEDRMLWDYAQDLTIFLRSASVRDLKDVMESLSLVTRDLPSAQMESFVVPWQNLLAKVIDYKNSLGGGN